MKFWRQSKNEPIRWKNLVKLWRHHCSHALRSFLAEFLIFTFFWIKIGGDRNFFAENPLSCRSPFYSSRIHEKVEMICEIVFFLSWDVKERIKFFSLFFLIFVSSRVSISITRTRFSLNIFFLLSQLSFVRKLVKFLAPSKLSDVFCKSLSLFFFLPRLSLPLRFFVASRRLIFRLCDVKASWGFFFYYYSEKFLLAWNDLFCLPRGCLFEKTWFRVSPIKFSFCLWEKKKPCWIFPWNK